MQTHQLNHDFDRIRTIHKLYNVKKYALISGDFVKTGGMDRANYALASFLAARGDEVHLAAHRAADDLTDRPNVTLHRVPKPLNSYLLGGPMIHRAGRRLAAKVSAEGGRVVVNGGNCLWGDVNWVHHVHAADAARVNGSLPKVLRGRLAYRIHVAEERRAVRQARLILTSCEPTRRDILERIGEVRPEIIHTVSYGVDASLFHPADPDQRAAIRARFGWAPDRPKVAFVGALGDRRKGFDTLFDAWSLLCRDPAWDADLVVVGRGAEVPAWQDRARSAGLADRIEFLGFVRDLPDLYRACDAHCLPSRYEGYSLVTQEALACGLPAFVSRTAGIADRYPESLAEFLIPDPDDAADLADRLRRWRSRIDADRALAAPFGQALRDHTWDHMAEQIAALIDAQGGAVNRGLSD
jgi:glycosyltransferase involved in cell wall biosynthesis